MVNEVLCPVCKNMKNRNLFRDGVCAECAESTLVSDSDILSTKPVDYTVKSQTQAQEDAELEFRLQAELERAKKEREEEFNAQQEAQKELARREAARRNLLPFVMYFNEDYIPGWVHADICRRLEKFSRDVAEKKSPRLMLFLPPRSGKSEIASKTFPAWHLGHYPNHDIIGCSYSAALAIDFSRKVRGLVQDERYHNIFPTRMDESSQSAERWNTSAGGGYVAAGVQGPITGRGAHCFPAGTMVTMADGSEKDISLVEIGDEVMSFDFIEQQYTPRKVIATQQKYDHRFTIVSTSGGRVTRSTNTHRFYITTAGWVQAQHLKKGHEVITNPEGVYGYDTISSVVTLETTSEPVYDIQVQGTECFFADGMLVHNCAIIDDPLKDRDSAESETIRQSIKDWYSSTFYTRLAPGGGVLVIMTRWHEADLAGWLLQCMKEAEQEAADTGEWPDDADRWEVVRYPAIATYDEPYRKAGEALHPERYDLKALNKIKRTLIPRDWEALYQQNPVSSDGDYFKKDFFRYYDTAPPLDTLRIYSAWDLAIGKKETNDFTCGVVVGVDRNSDIWLLHRYYGRFDANELIQQFFHCQRTWNPVLQGIEHGQIEMTLEPFILKEMNEKREKFNYTKLKTRGNDKLTRARPIQGRMEQGRVYFPRNADWAKEMESEMLAFPSGKHDDQVDAIAWIGQMLLMLAPQREHRPAPKKSWRDRLHKNLRAANSSGLSHMAS